MIASEQRSWESSKYDVKELKSTGFYKNDVELQKLVQQKEEVLGQIVPSPFDYSGKNNKMLWGQIRSLNSSIDFRINADATFNKILIVYYSKHRNEEYDGREIGCKEEYARELSNALFWKKFKSETLGSENLNADKLKDYSTIIFCSNSDVGTNKVASLIVKYSNQLKGKKVVLFTCKSMSVNFFSKIFNNKSLDSIILPEIREKLKIFDVKSGVFDNSDKKIFEPIVDYCSQNICIDYKSCGRIPLSLSPVRA